MARFTDAGERLGNARKWADRNAEDVTKLNSAELKKYGKRDSLWKFDASKYQDENKFDLYYIMFGKLLHASINNAQKMPSAISLPSENDVRFADIASLKIKSDEQANRLYMYSILRIKQLYEAGPDVFFDGGEVVVPVLNEQGEKIGEKKEYLSRDTVIRDIIHFYKNETKELYKHTLEDHHAAYGVKYTLYGSENSPAFFYQTGSKNTSFASDEVKKHQIFNDKLRNELVYNLTAFAPIIAGKKVEFATLFALSSPTRFFYKQFNNFVYKQRNKFNGQKFVDYSDFYRGSYARCMKDISTRTQRNIYLVTDENPTFSRQFLNAFHEYLVPSDGQELLMSVMRAELKLTESKKTEKKVEKKPVGFKSAKEEFKERYLKAAKKEINVKREYLSSITRKGINWRKDSKDIQPEDIVETFGFRGFEYGNWLTNKDRQNVTNAVYDACFDLAFVLGIEPKELGLKSPVSDKTLGLGIGTAGVKDSAASFQHPANVINMNKKNSAGAFAHEFMHAIDYHQNSHLGVTGKTDRKNPRMEKLVSLLKYQKNDAIQDLASLTQEEKVKVFLNRFEHNLNRSKQEYSDVVHHIMSSAKKTGLDNIKQLPFDSMVTILKIHRDVLQEKISASIQDLFQWAKERGKKIDMNVVNFRSIYPVAYIGAQSLPFKDEIYESMIYNPNSKLTGTRIGEAVDNYFETGENGKIKNAIAEKLVDQHPEIVQQMEEVGLLKFAKFYKEGVQRKIVQVDDEEYKKEYRQKAIGDIAEELTWVMEDLNNKLMPILVNESVKTILENNQDVFFMNEIYLSREYNTETDFYVNAKLADVTTPYYATDAELLARAFETWVGIELNKNGMHNHYLHKQMNTDGATIKYFDFYALEEKTKQNPLYPSKELAEAFGKEVKTLIRSQFLKQDIDLSNMEMLDKYEVWKTPVLLPSINEELEKKFTQNQTQTTKMQQMALF